MLDEVALPDNSGATTFTITTLSITTFSITTLSITTLSIMDLIVTLGIIMSVEFSYGYAECHYASVIMVNAIILNALVPSIQPTSSPN